MKNNQGTLLSVTLEQLRAFELNPRITRNLHYDEIKESIKNRRFDHFLKITPKTVESHLIPLLRRLHEKQREEASL